MREAASWFSTGRSAILVLLCYAMAALLGIWLSHAIDHRSFFQLAASKGDNYAYIQLTRTVLDRNYVDPSIGLHRQLSLGTPLAVSLVSALTRLDPTFALPMTCWIAAAFAWLIGCKLYGPLVAALMMCINIGIVERSLYGGPEALLLLLSLLALLMWRRSGLADICVAAAAMAFAAMLRPSALVFLAGGMLVLLRRRLFREAAVTSAITVAALAAYVLFIRDPHFGVNPITGYRGFWYGSSPVAVPFWPIIASLIDFDNPATVLIKEVPYMAMILAAVILAIRNFSTLAAELPFDLSTFLLSAWFVFSYNSFASLDEFHRYCVLCIPFACRLLANHYRPPVWSVCALCATAAVGSALSTEGIRESFGYFVSLVR